MSSTLSSVIISVASAVGKTFLIGAVGYLSVKYPKDNPILPRTSIDMLSRLTFNILLLPLIYTGLASSVTLDSLASLWLVVLASFVIIFISFLVALGLAYLPFFRVDKEEHFKALIIAICFPNIVAIPMLIFPALCEYEVFHGYSNIDTTMSLKENMMTCEQETNAVVFAYFFGFSILFWSFGALSIRRIKEKATPKSNDDVDENIRTSGSKQGLHNAMLSTFKRLCKCVFKVVKDIVLSPGFIVLIVAFVTSIIRPLQLALFKPGGVLRVIGSTLQSLTSAGATFATIIVAAALADSGSNGMDRNENELIIEAQNEVCELKKEKGMQIEDNEDQDINETDHFTGQYNHSSKGEEEIVVPAESLNERLPTLRTCTQIKRISKVLKHPSFKIQIWHIMSRLIVTPAVVYIILWKMGCSLTPIAKLVLLVNSALPGALIVVVLLKTHGLTEAALIVSQTYLPSYTLSVITIALWAAIGMMTFSDSDAC